MKAGLTKQTGHIIDMLPLSIFSQAHSRSLGRRSRPIEARKLSIRRLIYVCILYLSVLTNTPTDQLLLLGFAA